MTTILAAISLTASVEAAPAADPRYDQIQQKSAHNTYERHEALIDVLVYHRVRSIELDIHHSMSGDEVRPAPGDWFVYHVDRGKKRSTCKTLSSCLRILRGFHDTFPRHEVTTVFVDLKDDFRSANAQSGDDFDRRLETDLGKGLIVTPAELRGAAPSLRGAVANGRWPATSRLRGKFFFVLTGKTEWLKKYAAAASRRAFVAPEIKADGDVAKTEKSLGSPFLNLKADRRKVAAAISSAGLVGRVYDLGEGSFRDARAKGANHLGTDYVSYEKDPWSKTHNALGWPAVCRGVDCSRLREAGTTIVVEAASGDIWASTTISSSSRGAATTARGAPSSPRRAATRQTGRRAA